LLKNLIVEQSGISRVYSESDLWSGVIESNWNRESLSKSRCC